MDLIESLLSLNGPTRSSRLATQLRSELGLDPEAARKRISRVKPPLFAFPIPLLPKQEKFIYHVGDRATERFWSNLHRDLRETEAVYGAAIDGLAARGGVVLVDEFPVISGAPAMQRKQVSTTHVLQRLQAAELVRIFSADYGGDAVFLSMPPLMGSSVTEFHVRQIAEGVLLDGVREWARRLGMAGYNTIAIRGDDHPRMVGPYKWDLTGPSYLMPLKPRAGVKNAQGFLVADAFAGSVLDEFHIRYFIRKARGLQASTNVGILPVLVAQGFTSEALTQGHRAGLMMATPESMFGTRVGTTFNSLVDTLRNAAAIVAGNPARLVDLLADLKDISGRSGNLRGILFELICAYLVRDTGTSVDLGRKAFDDRDGKYYDIDVICVRGRAECVLYECKAGEPGSTVSLGEVDDWLHRLPAFAAYVRTNNSLREAKVRFEIWASGDFEPDALAKLQYEQQRRTQMPIAWKNGSEVRKYGIGLKEKTITDAIDQHFFRHPLSR